MYKIWDKIKLFKTRIWRANIIFGSTNLILRNILRSRPPKPRSASLDVLTIPWRLVGVFLDIWLHFSLVPRICHSSPVRPVISFLHLLKQNTWNQISHQNSRLGCPERDSNQNSRLSSRFLYSDFVHSNKIKLKLWMFLRHASQVGTYIYNSVHNVATELQFCVFANILTIFYLLNSLNTYHSILY
jgi:hypothetical protein